ncbi:hypothetical protein FRC06_009652, partial [Ceratobasidium sp. 370]
KLSVILVVDKRAVAHASTTFSAGSGPVPWSKWSSNRFHVLPNVRLASAFQSSPLWGNRIIALGPEPDKLALFDFCSVGAKAASVVWKAPSARGSSSTFSGGGGGRINGGVSVRAALAQRARTLVRADSLGVGVGWFEGMGVGVSGFAEQMPYVVSVKRGISGVESAAVDAERVVILAFVTVTLMYVSHLVFNPSLHMRGQLKKYMDSNPAKPWRTRTSPKKAIYVVLTDGNHADTRKIIDIITDMASFLKTIQAPSTPFGIEFVQIGEPSDSERLHRAIDQDEKVRGIVGIDAYNGGTLEIIQLRSMLLRSVNSENT